MTTQTVNKPQKLPMWVKRQIRKQRKAGLLPDTGERGDYGLLRSVFAKFEDILDHWGKADEVFYTEPYGEQYELADQATSLANVLECKWRFAKSQWNPPCTVRIEFYR